MPETQHWAAHEQVVVFDGSGPVRRKADFNSRAHGATPTGVARLIEDRREAVITDLNFNDLRGTAVTMLSEAGKPVQQVPPSSHEVTPDCRSAALVAGGGPVHFLQKRAHCIELRPEAFPISGLQSLHGLIVAIKRLPRLTCRWACDGRLLCRA
jgi:hypothetical protein